MELAHHLDPKGVAIRFHSSWPATSGAQLDVAVVATVNSSGNADLTGLLHRGRSVLTGRSAASANQNGCSTSALTSGERVGGAWNSALRWGVGKFDKAGRVSFALDR